MLVTSLDLCQEYQAAQHKKGCKPRQSSQRIMCSCGNEATLACKNCCKNLCTNCSDKKHKTGTHQISVLVQSPASLDMEGTLRLSCFELIVVRVSEFNVTCANESLALKSYFTMNNNVCVFIKKPNDDT